ncbi:MAG: AAA family ATPase [Vicinamibacterales bacterium]
MALANVSQPLVAVELALEAETPDAIAADIRDAVQGYNEDDCRSTEALRDWLERLRAQALADGCDIPRPGPGDDEAPASVTDLQAEVEALRRRLLHGLPEEAAGPAHPSHARWLLAYLIDFHKREENADWWEYFRVLEAPEEDWLDEPRVLTGLVHDCEVRPVLNKKTGKPTGSVVHRYRYPNQETQIGKKGTLKLATGQSFGSVDAHDRVARTIEIKTKAEHPSTLYLSDVVSNRVLQLSVMRLAEGLADAAGDASQSSAGLALLGREAPRLRSGTFARLANESAADFAVRIVTDLSQTTLAIQGPPGAGKTHVGAAMIRALARAGRRVGVTASGHKVIANLLEAVVEQAARAGEVVRTARKPSDGDESGEGTIALLEGNVEALAAITSGEVHVLGGTPWMWSREEFQSSVDVLFVDEAGQMSLASALAVSHAADSLVLLGDPQQLDQPQKASHPDGVGVSALTHVLGGAETMPADRGIFLPTTWRMSPAITRFTSELFYEGKLEARAEQAAQVLRGTGRFDGSGLWLVPVTHDGNQNASDEEVEAVADIVSTIVRPGACWVDEHGHSHAMMSSDLRVVAPFNAQVNRLSDRLGALGVPVGAVDKFQGRRPRS